MLPFVSHKNRTESYNLQKSMLILCLLCALESSVDSSPIYISYINSVNITLGSKDILNQMGVPGWARVHSYDYLMLEGWSCSTGVATASPLDIWMNPQSYSLGSTLIPSSLQPTNQQTKRAMEDAYSQGNVQIIASIQLNYSRIIENIDNAQSCATSFIIFLNGNSLKGVSINITAGGYPSASLSTWMKTFISTIHQNVDSPSFILMQTIDVDLLDTTKRPSLSNYGSILKSTSPMINFTIINYSSSSLNYTSYHEVF